VRSIGLQLLDNIHALHHTAEHNMLVVQPAGLHSGNEELTAIGVGPSISHGHNTRASVLQLEVLISELAAIDGLATSAIVVGEVSTLAHEVGDDTVENATLVTETLFSCAESTEVFGSFGHNITPQLNNYSASRLAVNGHIKEHARKTHG